MLKEIKVITPSSFKDNRGELYTVFNQKDTSMIFNHYKVSISYKNVLRGLHSDDKSTKLITCLKGKVYLAVVDVRKDSSTYLQWNSYILSGKNKKQVLVPPGFANGHLVLSKKAVFFYKWSYEGDYPDVQEQHSYRWNDPKINIKWPLGGLPVLSERDKSSTLL